jgi:ACT domain-containing protein
MLEEDGRIDEQIFNEYVALNLRYPPQFIQVSSAKMAFKVMEEENIELVINIIRSMDYDRWAKISGNR